MQPRRSWDAAIDKVQAEGSRCRVCKSQNMVQCAHIIAREHDRRAPLGAIPWKTYTVAPDRIVPLCRECHQRYDAHQLDLLPYLRLEEVLQAVADSAHGRGNGLEAARIRITGRMEVPA